MEKYQFKTQPIPLNMKSAAPASLTANQPGVRPLLGPEIGPDPRNAICTVILPVHPTMDGGNGIRFDFVHGYRISFPAGDGRYRLKTFDLDSGMHLEEHVHKGGDEIAGDPKYFIRYRLEVYDESTGKLIFEHNYACEGRDVVIVIPDGGLGENISWVPFAEEFRLRKRANVTCIMGEWMIRLVQDQYPGIKFVPIAQKPPVGNAYACYFCGIQNEQRLNWRPVEHQQFGMQGTIAKILGLPKQNLKVRLKLGSKRPFPEPFVCISAMATNPSKYWNFPDGWNQIIRWLKSFGYRVLCIDRDKQLNFAGKLFAAPAEAEDFTGAKPISQRIDLLQHADFFIGLPSGLSWLAWNCNVPVVMLSGFSMEGAEFPTPYRITNFLFCHGCWNDSHLFFDMNAPIWCPRHGGTARQIECTRVITPKMVMESIRTIPQFQTRLAEIREQTLRRDNKAPVKVLPDASTLV